MRSRSMLSRNAVVVVVAGVVGAVLLGSGCGGGRANPKVEKIVHAKGTDHEAPTTIAYDDAGHPEKITTTAGATTTTIEFVWKDGALTTVNHTLDNGTDPPLTDDTDLTFDGGKLTSTKGSFEATFDYDDAGRVAGFDAPDFANGMNLALQRGDDGKLTKATTKLGLTTLTTSLAFNDDGLPDTVTVDPGAGGDVVITTVGYKKGKLSKIESATPAGNQTQSFDYDDQGRISGASTEIDGNDVDDDLTIAYGEGDAAGLFVFPDLAGGLLLWDAHGDTHADVDVDALRLTPRGAW